VLVGFGREALDRISRLRIKYGLTIRYFSTYFFSTGAAFGGLDLRKSYRFLPTARPGRSRYPRRPCASGARP